MKRRFRTMSALLTMVLAEMFAPSPSLLAATMIILKMK